MSSDAQRLEVSHVVLIVDPFLKTAFEEAIKENSIEHLRDVSTVKMTYSTIKIGTGKGAVVLTDSHYLSESILELKVNGVRKIILIDTATSLKPSIRIAEMYPVYASGTMAYEGVFVPPVPSIPLFNKVVEVLGKDKEVLAFTTRLPHHDIIMIDLIKKKGFDVIDKNSALFYEVCRNRLDCVVLDLVDSNVSKGIEKEDVWSERSKYYVSMLSSLSEALNKLLPLEL